MFRAIMTGVVVLLAFWLARRARRAAGSPREYGASRAIAWFAASALAQHALMESWKLPWLDAARPLLLGATAFAGLIALVALLWLVHLHPRRRDPWFRFPLFAVAAITALAGAPWGVSAGFVCAGTLCFRWKDGYPSGTLFQLGLGAIALSVLLLVRLPLPAVLFEDGHPLLSLALLSRWTSFIAVFHTIAGVVALFAGFVRDPTLGIRRVGRRLAMSHLLVVLLPLALTALLWAVTTIVGVGSERARVAARVFETEALGLRHGIDAALASGDAAPLVLRRAVAARADSARGGRAWWIREGRMERLLGAPLANDSLLAGWFAASDTVPRAGILAFGGASWIAAASGDPRDRAAIVLLPSRAVGDSLRTRFIGGEVRILGNTADEIVVVDPDSMRAARRAAAAARGPRVRVTAPGDTIDAITAEGDSAPVAREQHVAGRHDGGRYAAR
jgi:hypothetical protein